MITRKRLGFFFASGPVEGQLCDCELEVLLASCAPICSHGAQEGGALGMEQ